MYDEDDKETLYTTLVIALSLFHNSIVSILMNTVYKEKLSHMKHKQSLCVKGQLNFVTIHELI